MEAGVYAAYLQQATHSADAETPIRPPPIRPDIRSVLGDMLGILYALKIKIKKQILICGIQCG